ncbi:unnamed protein product [Kuraishia capsulata CBS 1993]|uniref:PCI domain-containing protein n=1 Tax=Kuraishia capsulata CBS 1993 TaxID=1382522 RepID=W6MJ93_9ASCO|nr:uncharacterized protein KUCA_T00002297001 [Kuraishia capsulata CBS 1993]CDK26326.1 unnamed protein product [Kuraishia capsulata CBS 1993]
MEGTRMKPSAKGESLYKYIGEFALAIQSEDGSRLAQLVSMALSETLYTRANYEEPQESELRRLKPNWREVVKAYLHVTKVALKENDLKKVVFSQTELLTHLSRCAERESNWVLPALLLVTRQVSFLYSAYEGQKSKEALAEEEELAVLEKVVEAVNRPFKICLSDKSDLRFSKKSAVYFFAGQLFKYYRTMKKYELSKSIEKALAASATELPSITAIPKKSAVIYLYYSGCLACIDNDFEKANDRLSQALLLCHKDSFKQKQSILVTLIPVRFIVTRQLPSKACLTSLSDLGLAYSDIFRAVKLGDLALFDSQFQRLQSLLLKKNLYYVFLKMRMYVVAKLVKVVCSAMTGKFQISVASLSCALEYSGKQPEGSFSADYTESIVANLISQGLVKGYLSHGNRVLVLSKKEPFPVQVLAEKQ